MGMVMSWAINPVAAQAAEFEYGPFGELIRRRRGSASFSSGSRPSMKTLRRGCCIMASDTQSGYWTVVLS